MCLAKPLATLLARLARRAPVALALALCLATVPAAGLRAQAQQPALPAPAAPAAATVSGVVHDSLARAPLADALVQIVAADVATTTAGRTTAADSLGRFRFDSVPDGRWLIGFYHPMLDSIGIESPTRELFVAGGRSVRMDLAIPAPARLVATICGPEVARDSGAVLFGIVRHASTTAPVAGANVTGEWLEISFTSAGFVRRAPSLTSVSAQNGWFALCNVPRGGTMAITAAHDADSTSRLEVQVPAHGVLRRDLYVGAARTVIIADTTSPDSLALAPRTLRVGSVRITGRVTTLRGGKPLAGAQVRIVDGPDTRTDEQGAWALHNAPPGTRMLEVRAVGYYPEQRAVNVVAGAAPVHVALSTLKAVLDTVRVTAARVYDRRLLEFNQRRRSGMGRFITAEDIARRRPWDISDLFRLMPGMRVEGHGLFRSVLTRGVFGWCSPAIYIDGHGMTALGVSDLDMWVRPSDVVGIEVYTGAAVPPQFQQPMGGCGSIVVWTK